MNLSNKPEPLILDKKTDQWIENPEYITWRKANNFYFWAKFWGLTAAILLTTATILKVIT